MSLNNGSKTSKNDFYSKTGKNVESDFYSKTFQKKSSERGSPPQYEEAIQHLHPRKPSGEYHQFNKQQQQQHQQQQQQQQQQIPTYSSYSLNSYNSNSSSNYPSSISLPSPPPYQSAPSRDFSKSDFPKNENRFVKPVPLTSYGLVAQNRFTPSPAR
jgi:hypothetical protein